MAYMFGGTAGVTAGNMKVFTGLASLGTLTFSLGGWSSGASAQNAVISGVSANTAGNYQFLLTMRNYTYVYLFGEKMGDVIVSGVAAFECAEWTHGLTNAVSYYNTYGITITGTPVALSFAGYSAWAFLVGASFNYISAKTRLAQFKFKFKSVTS